MFIKYLKHKKYHFFFQNPELLEHIRKIEQTCRSKLGLSGKSHADNVIKIEVPDEAVPCIRVSSRRKLEFRNNFISVIKL